MTLQQWLTLRSRFADPFDPALFDQIDERLTRMSPSADLPGRSDPAPTARMQGDDLRRRRVRAGRADTDRPISRPA